MQIIGIFMVHEYKYTGIKEVANLRYCLEGYDEGSEFPERSGWSYTRYFFPEQFDRGLRLADSADELLEVFIELQQEEGLRATTEIPMQYLTLTIDYILRHCGVNGEVVDRITKQNWKKLYETRDILNLRNTMIRRGASMFSFPNVRKQNYQSYCWDSSWIKPFESPWSIFEKFKYANSVSSKDIISLFQALPKNHITTSDKNLYSLEKLDQNKFLSILRKDVHVDNQVLLQKLNIIMPFEHAAFLSESLVFCDECISDGFHSTLHQIIGMERCPFHLTSLRLRCPSCSTKFPYELSEINRSEPFICRCGYSFLKTNSFKENISTWRFKTPIDISRKEIRDWTKLNKGQLERASYLLFHPEPLINNMHDSLRFYLSILKDSSITLDERFIYNKFTYIFREFLPPSEEKKYVDELIETSHKCIKSIARHLRKTLIRNHRHCIRKLVRRSNEDVCPYAFAYVLWRQFVEGLKKYSLTDNNNLSRGRKKSYFESASKQDDYFISQLYDHLLTLQLKGLKIGKNETIWILNRLHAHLVLNHFRNWLRHTDYYVNNNKIPVQVPFSYEHLPFFVFELPSVETNGKIEFHYWYPKVNDTELICSRWKCPEEKI